MTLSAGEATIDGANAGALADAGSISGVTWPHTRPMKMTAKIAEPTR